MQKYISRCKIRKKLFDFSGKQGISIQKIQGFTTESTRGTTLIRREADQCLDRLLLATEMLRQANSCAKPVWACTNLPRRGKKTCPLYAVGGNKSDKNLEQRISMKFCVCS
jgi:hypothetical protein